MKRYHALSKTVERDSETFVRFGLNRVSAVLGGQGACHRWGERQLHQIFKVMVQVGGVRRTRSLIKTTKEDSVCQFAVDSHVEIPPLWFSDFPIRHCFLSSRARNILLPLLYKNVNKNLLSSKCEVEIHC